MFHWAETCRVGRKQSEKKSKILEMDDEGKAEAGFWGTWSCSVWQIEFVLGIVESQPTESVFFPSRQLQVFKGGGRLHTTGYRMN